MQILDRPSSNGHATGRIETLILDLKQPRRKPWLAALAALLAVAIVATGVVGWRVRAGAAVSYVTAPVVRQNLVQSVSATGTVNPQNTVSVGTQVSGTISEVDVDYNSAVHKGQVLARLDPAALQAALDSARAALAQAEEQAAAARAAASGATSNITTVDATAQAAIANARAAKATAASNAAAVAGAEANVTKAQSALQLAQQTVSRDQQLLAQGYIAQAQADSDQSALVVAQTGLQSAQIAVQQARSAAIAGAAQAQAGDAQTAAEEAAIQSARSAALGSSASAGASAAAIGIEAAAVQQAEDNLQHSIITSPVDGTVVARNVSVGVTVAASLQTPTLFSIAQDLSKMEVDLAVGEPDIGSVRPGESVAFSVLAYPNRIFHGVVSQVRKSPVITQNVVTYTTVVLVDNRDQALLPGMTANATIDVATAKDAFVVPLAALSYQPVFSGTSAARKRPAGTPGSAAPGAPAANAGSPWGATTGSPSATVAGGSTGRIFVRRNGRLAPVRVAIELVSGTQAAVTPAAPATLAAGEAVVIADDHRATARPPSGPPATAFGGAGSAGGSAMRGIH